MSLGNALALAALIAAAFLILTPARLPAIFATAAAGLEVLMSSGVVHLSTSRYSITLILGLVLLVAGVFCYLRVHAKSAVSAATIVVLVGVVQVLRGSGAV